MKEISAAAAHGKSQERRRDGFTPQPWARNAHIQSIFASLKLRALGTNEMVDASREIILDCTNNARLLGYYSPHPRGKALVLLLHGWEGSADSTYILHSGRYFYRNHFDIFRLNLRDHGETHHLNEGIFHGALLDEVVEATHRVAELAAGRPFFIVGFSLGGNFALRIARSHGTRPITGLRHIVCVSPLLDPYKATLCIDNGMPIYRYYFRKKWKRSLKQKGDLFPDLYDFKDILQLHSTLAMTDLLIQRYSDFSDYREYFNQYTLLGDALADLTIPVTAIASEDDPVIPAGDFHELTKNSFLELDMQPYGGHCGFLHPFPFGCWYEPHCTRIFDSYIEASHRHEPS